MLALRMVTVKDVRRAQIINFQYIYKAVNRSSIQNGFKKQSKIKAKFLTKLEFLLWFSGAESECSGSGLCGDVALTPSPAHWVKGFGIAVVCSRGLDSIPGPGTSICCGCGHERRKEGKEGKFRRKEGKKRKEKKRKGREERKERKKRGKSFWPNQKE